MKICLSLLVTTLVFLGCANEPKKVAKKSPEKKASECKTPAADPADDNNNDNDPWGSSYGLQESSNFADIKSYLTAQCASCHQGYDTEEIAKDKIKTYIDRMDLDESNPLFMPKGGTKATLPVRKQLIQWEYSLSNPSPTSNNGNDTIDEGENTDQLSTNDPDC